MHCKRLVLAISLALAMAASAFAQPFQITVDHDLDSQYNIPFAVMLQQNEDQMGGGASWAYSVSGAGTITNPFEQGASTGILTLIGLYNGGSGNDPGVAMLMGNGYAPEFVGMPWESIFSSHTEQEIIDALLGVQAGGSSVDPGIEVLSEFFNQNLSVFAGNMESASFVGYSSHTILGSGSWQQQPVPEPGLLLAAGAGLAFFVRRRKAA